MSNGPEPNSKRDTPVLIFTIANGAGHIRVAEGIAAAIGAAEPSMPVRVIDVVDYMSRVTRFTHVTAYLWLVKHFPAAWDRIDRYQKKQPHTSPDWYYRRGCQSLFELACSLKPRAMVATEVGCCELASLIKRDLKLDIPLLAVNDDFDADRAWVKPEVDLYCFVTEALGEELIYQGAPRERVKICGAPLSAGYDVPRQHEKERAEVCRWLGLDNQRPIILVAGGGEGIGQIEQTTARLLELDQPSPQIVVLTGRNARLKLRCEGLATNGSRDRLRVLGWTGPEHMPKLMSGADLMVSKLGSMFNEAVASELPVVALEPPPGSERVQYRLLNEWNVGRAVRTLDQIVETIADLLNQPEKLLEMRNAAQARRKLNASERIARWIVEASTERQAPSSCQSNYHTALGL